jgi:hypothetical protein
MTRSKTQASAAKPFDVVVVSPVAARHVSPTAHAGSATGIRPGLVVAKPLNRAQLIDVLATKRIRIAKTPPKDDKPELPTTETLDLLHPFGTLGGIGGLINASNVQFHTGPPQSSWAEFDPGGYALILFSSFSVPIGTTLIFDVVLLEGAGMIDVLEQTPNIAGPVSSPELVESINGSLGHVLIAGKTSLPAHLRLQSEHHFGISSVTITRV